MSNNNETEGVTTELTVAHSEDKEEEHLHEIQITPASSSPREDNGLDDHYVKGSDPPATVQNSYPASCDHPAVSVQSSDSKSHNDKIKTNDNVNFYSSDDDNKINVSVEEVNLKCHNNVFASSDSEYGDKHPVSAEGDDPTYTGDVFVNIDDSDPRGTDLEEQALFLQLLEDGFSQVPTTYVKESIELNQSESAGVIDTTNSGQLQEHADQGSFKTIQKLPKSILKKGPSLIHKNTGRRVKFSETMKVFSEDFDEPQITAMRVTDLTLAEMCLMYDPPPEYQDWLNFEPPAEYRDPADDLAFLLQMEFPDAVFEVTAFTSDPSNGAETKMWHDSDQIDEGTSDDEEVGGNILEDSVTDRNALEVTPSQGKQEDFIVEIENKRPESTRDMVLEESEHDVDVKVTSDHETPELTETKKQESLEATDTKSQGGKSGLLYSEIIRIEDDGVESLDELMSMNTLNQETDSDSGISSQDTAIVVPGYNLLKKAHSDGDSSFLESAGDITSPSDWMDPYEVSGVLRKNSQIRRIIEMNALRRRLMTSAEVRRRNPPSKGRLRSPTQSDSTLMERLRWLTAVDSEEETEEDLETELVQSQGQTLPKSSQDDTLETPRTDNTKGFLASIPNSLGISRTDSTVSLSTGVITCLTQQVSSPTSLQKTVKRPTSFGKDWEKRFLQGKMFQRPASIAYIPGHSESLTPQAANSNNQPLLKQKTNKMGLDQRSDKRVLNILNRPSSWVETHSSHIEKHSTSLEELAQFVKQDLDRIERIRKRYSLAENEDPTFGFARRPSVRGIRTRFGSTNEIIQQMQTQLRPHSLASSQCAGSHMTWPGTEVGHGKLKQILNSQKSTSAQPSGTREEGARGGAGILHGGPAWKILLRKTAKTAASESRRAHARSKDKKEGQKWFSVCSSKLSLRHKANITKYLMPKDERGTPEGASSSPRVSSDSLYQKIFSQEQVAGESC
ncbi:uncharacterized protein LOC106465170 isoform X2 [Limulus polyphemus]|uniref:Uncharacterized protein LOC106465170 isoform X2 n=1 Tax=Limulus polyphemus TaxID=6850 RepID=A0ABM1SYK8_LIMPO|nr:uncharacterized protein LOC106465170 isoform X2 [Limulus polyphemus]